MTADRIATLIADGRAHDAAMTPGPWQEDLKRPGVVVGDVSHADGPVDLIDMQGESLGADSIGVCWLRTNLGALLDALEAERARNAKLLECKRDDDAEIERLRAEVVEVRYLHSRSCENNERLRARADLADRIANPLRCAAARPGETTYECDVTKPCEPCRLRARIAELEDECAGG